MLYVFYSWNPSSGIHEGNEAQVLALVLHSPPPFEGLGRNTFRGVRSTEYSIRLCFVPPPLGRKEILFGGVRSTEIASARASDLPSFGEG